MQKIFVVLFLATSILATSCSNDDMESITLKRNGSINITVLKGDEPLANQKVRITSLSTNNEIDVLITNEKGTVDFGKLNDGPYEITVEATVHNFIKVVQEVQVISGESINKTIQLDEYLIDYTVELKNMSEELIDELTIGTFQVGICVLPATVWDQKDVSDPLLIQDLIASSIAIKYFEITTSSSSRITASLPVGEYVALTIVNQDNGSVDFGYFHYHRFEVRRLDENIFKEFEI